MTFILEKLGAQNESEIFIGNLIDKSKFKQLHLLENFYSLSQTNLISLQNQLFEKFNQSFEDLNLPFKNEKSLQNLEVIRIAKTTYLVSYYFAGCQSEIFENVSSKTLKAWKNKIIGNENNNQIYLGLPWLIFSDVLIELKKNKNP